MTTTPVDLSPIIRDKRKTNPTVAIGYLYGQDVAAGFANSLAAMLWFQARGTLVTEVFAEASGVNVSHGRNELCRQTLASNCDWLLMLDADMTFRPDLPDQLVAAADPVAAPIVGALAFGIDDGVLFPTLYAFTEGDGGGLATVRYHDFPPDTLWRVGGTGAAALLIHHTALEAIAAGEFSPVWPWFQETALGDQRIGEDLTFCLRAAVCEIPVHVHTGITVGHQKAHVLTAAQFAAQRAAS
jgi:hypothetical protein